MTAIEVVDLNQIIEDVHEVVKIDRARGFGHSLVDLKYQIDRFYVLGLE